MIDQSACTKKATVASGNVLTLSRRRYCHGHGGKPDLIWLLTVLPTLLRERGDSQQLIRETSRSLIEVALEVGYTSPSHFTKVFRRMTGVTPTEFRSTL